MMVIFPRARVPGISPIQWKKAKPFFKDEGAKIEPAHLCSATGMDIDAAYALVVSVCKEDLADLYLLVMHSCVDHPVAERPYLDGFQPVPWKCPECETKIMKQAQLRYELRAVLRAPIKFTRHG
jgi:hypothetical protein